MYKYQLEEIKNWPEAISWPLFDAWFEQINEIDKSNRDIIKILQSPNPDDKKMIRFFVKKIDRLRSSFFEYPFGPEVSYGNVDYLERKLAICRLVCFEKEDMIRRGTPLSYLPSGQHVLEVLSWYIPTWFAEIYEPLLVNREYAYLFNYLQCLQYERLGSITLTAEIVAPRLGYDIISNLGKPQYLKEIIADNPQIMERDIWFLFAGEFWVQASFMSYHDNIEIRDRRQLLFDFFIDKCEAGVMDRRRVLTECLRAVGRSLSTTQSSLYLPMLTALKPSKDELLELSSELMGVDRKSVV